MEVLILIPKETYNTCNFLGGGGGGGGVGGSGSPDPHLSMNSLLRNQENQ